jgi:hypothetical protein
MTQLNSISGMYKVGDKFYNSNGKHHKEWELAKKKLIV